MRRERGVNGVSPGLTRAAARCDPRGHGPAAELTAAREGFAGMRTPRLVERAERLADALNVPRRW
jgi:hypothetical protein